MRNVESLSLLRLIHCSSGIQWMQMKGKNSAQRNMKTKHRHRRRPLLEEGLAQVHSCFASSHCLQLHPVGYAMDCCCSSEGCRGRCQLGVSRQMSKNKAVASLSCQGRCHHRRVQVAANHQTRHLPIFCASVFKCQFDRS